MTFGVSRSSSLEVLQEAGHALSFNNDTIISVVATEYENIQAKVLAQTVATPWRLMKTIMNSPVVPVLACESPTRR
jgi:hypothetical protein